MKSLRYLIVLIMVMFSFSITVNACSTDDKCTNCRGQAEQAACEVRLRAIESTKKPCSKDDGCAGCTNTGAYQQCMSKNYNGSTYTGACSNADGCAGCPNTAALQECKEKYINNSGNNGGNGGSSSTTTPDNTVLCSVCSSLDSGASQETKDACIQAGCPIGDNTWEGNISYENYLEDYDPSTTNKLVGCERVFGAYSNGKFTDTKSLGYFLQTAFNIIKYIVPIILIVLTMVDFLKAVSSGDKEIVKTATGKLTKRAVIALAIFLIPTILQLVLGLVTKYGTCGIK